VEVSTIKLLCDYEQYKTQVLELMNYFFDYGRRFPGTKLAVVLYRAQLYYGWALVDQNGGYSLQTGIANSKRAAELFAGDYGSPYWYSEAVALASVQAAASVQAVNIQVPVSV
jgi:hypothetical protein